MAVVLPSGSLYQQKVKELQTDDLALTPEYRAILKIKQASFSGVVYGSEDALIAAALQPGPAQDFVRYFLALRANKDTRVTFAKFTSLALTGGGGGHHWRALKARIWTVYNIEPRMTPQLE
jgi:hypothetical protein